MLASALFVFYRKDVVRFGCKRRRCLRLQSESAVL